MLKNISKEDQFINDGLKEIDKEIKTEDEIKSQATYITELLIKEPVVRVEYAGSVYTLTQRQGKQPQKVTDPSTGKIVTIQINAIVLVAINESRRRQAYLANKAYLAPATYVGEYNDEFTLYENLFAVVEAFLRHVTGELRIQSTDDGIAKIAREKDMKK